MGLAASQARYLALTARKSDLEFQSQTINTRRIQLAYRTAEIARAYSEGMNNQQIMMSRTDSKGDTVWSSLSFSDILKDGFVIIPAGGKKWSEVGNENPYTVGEMSQEIDYYMATTFELMSETEAKKCLATEGDWDTVKSQLCETEVKKELKAGSTDEYEEKTYYKFNSAGITSELFKKLSAATQSKFNPVKKGVVSLSVNTGYNGLDAGNMDIQSLLTSGKAQIVSKAFYDYLASTYGYNPDSYPLPGAVFAQAQTKFDQNEDHANMGKEQAIYDWRADEQGKFKSRNYTEDDAKVLAEYEAATAEVQAQDKQLEIQEKNIETQHKAIETELESIQKVIQQNIEKTFKIFS